MDVKESSSILEHTGSSETRSSGDEGTGRADATCCGCGNTPCATSSSDTCSKVEHVISPLLMAYDRAEDAVQAIEFACAASKRRRRRQGPLLRSLRMVRKSVLTALELVDVTVLPLSEYVDYSVHEVIGTVVSSQPGDDGRIVEVARCGFVRRTALLRPQQVVVQKYVPGLETIEKGI